jgi:hypothetical protein
LGFSQVNVSAVARLDLSSREVPHDRRSMNAELLCQGVSWLPSLIVLANLRHLVRGHSMLLLARRPDGSTGRLITVLTSENTCRRVTMLWLE